MIDRVLTSSKSKGTPRLVLIALADVAHDSGEVSAYARSHKILAAKANCHEDTVQKAISALVDLGEVKVTRRGDGRASTDYIITIEGGRESTPGEASGHPTGDDAPPQGGRETPPIIPSSPVVDPSLPVEPCAAPPLVLVTGSPDVDPFEEFWKVYPNKRGKPAARGAFAAACKRAPAAAIIAGAGRYRDDPNRSDSFTKWPQGWLREDRWDDPPLPSRTGAPSPNAGIDTDRSAPGGELDWRTS